MGYGIIFLGGILGGLGALIEEIEGIVEPIGLIVALHLGIFLVLLNYLLGGQNTTTKGA